MPRPETPDPSLPEGTEEKDSSSTKTLEPVSGAPPKPFLTLFLEHLVRNGIISNEVAVEAAAVKNRTASRDKRGTIDILVDEFQLARNVLQKEVARFYSFRVINPNERGSRALPLDLVSQLMAGLPQEIDRLATKHKVLPFETAENQPDKLVVVTPNPSDREVHIVARAFPYKRFEICFMTEVDWTEFNRQIMLDKQHKNVDFGLADSLFEEEEPELDSQLEKEINRSELIQIIETVFTEAVNVGASDIHIVPRAPRRTDILLRIDGQLTLWRPIEDVRAEAVVAVVKGRSANLDRFERMSAQDGSAQKVVDDQMIRFRMSVLPIFSRSASSKFESVVIRILKDANASVTLETIGFDPYSLRVFQEAISKPNGIVILTGPTGSGKSTTLVAALRSVMKPSLNTITVEDPVEYLIEGARQVKLNHKLDFEDAMRAILRHDPDIVMLGEIRDRITADIAIKLANTGHLTFSTLHTNDAPSTVSRLFKIGVEPFLIAQALNIVVAQRLVRRLCEHCKTPMQNVAPQALTRMGFTQQEIEQTTIYEAGGCTHCVEGYKGRAAIHESLYITSQVRDIILDSGEKIDIERIREAAIKHGMQTLRRSGIELIKKGITSIEEVVGTTTTE